jgi:hypothetical protein
MYFFISPFLSIKQKSQRKERKELSISRLPSLRFLISYPFSPCIFPSKKQGKSHRNTNKQKIKMCCTFSLTYFPSFSLIFFLTTFLSIKKKNTTKRKKTRTKISPFLTLLYSFPLPSLSDYLQPNFINFHNIMK